MCLLSYYAPGIVPNMEHLTNGTLWNADGHGYAIVTERNTLIVRRGMDASQILDEFERDRGRHPSGPAMFHSRLGTHGTMGRFNVHPFRVGSDPSTVLAHNGIISGLGWGRKDRRSDTRIFANVVVPKRFAKLDKARTRAKIEKYLGPANKVAILTVNPKYRCQAYLFNEHRGEWVDGAWHSNLDYLSQPTYQGKYGNYGGYLVTYGSDSEPSATLMEGGPDWEDCNFCHSYGCVDPLTFVCRQCKGCFVCGMDVNDCACWEGSADEVAQKAAAAARLPDPELESDAQAAVRQGWDEWTADV